MDMEHERRLTTVENLAQSNAARLDSVERRQDNLDELVGTVKALAVREENIENTVKEIKDDVKNLNEKPAKRWENLWNTILVAVVTAVVGFLLGQLL